MEKGRGSASPPSRDQQMIITVKQRGKTFKLYLLHHVILNCDHHIFITHLDLVKKILSDIRDDFETRYLVSLYSRGYQVPICMFFFIKSDLVFIGKQEIFLVQRLLSSLCRVRQNLSCHLL